MRSHMQSTNRYVWIYFECTFNIHFHTSREILGNYKITDESISFLEVTSESIPYAKKKRYLGQYRCIGCDKFPIYCCTVQCKYKCLCRNGEGLRSPVTRAYVPTGSDVPFEMGRGVFSTNFFLHTEIEISVL